MNGKQKKKRYNLSGKLKYQAAFLLLVVFVLPVLLGFSYYVDVTISEMERSSMELSEKTTQQISAELSAMHNNLLNISEIFSNDEWLLSLLARNYSESSTLKKANMRQIKNRFIEADSLDSGFLIDAIYTKEGELFNFYTADRKRYEFYDPISEDQMLLLESLDITDPDTFAKLIWHPVQENILSPEVTGNPRQDRVLIGSRRTFHRYLGRYLNTHIFIVPEWEIFEKYSAFLRENQTVWILNEEGTLISSSDQAYLEEKPLPKEIIERIGDAYESASFTSRSEGIKQLISYTKDTRTGWYTIMEVPAVSVSQYIIGLFQRLMVVFLLSVVLFSIGIVIFSRQISKPLEKMVDSMHKVSRGEFIPVPNITRKNEIGEITRYYNVMVRDLERMIEEKYEKDKKSRELEAKVLVGQINPHFVYNTLETIVWKANQAKLPEIGVIASQLGKLLRSSVKSDDFVIPISQEIEQTMIYRDIQKIRYKEKLNIEILSFPETWEGDKVLRLILQPCIENSIVHGMRGNRHVLNITVEIKREEDSLFFIVKDNGIGMPQERLSNIRGYINSTKTAPRAIKTTGSGIGLKNIQERLHLYFGALYGLQIDSSPDGGTTVTIHMPLIPPEKTFSF